MPISKNQSTEKKTSVARRAVNKVKTAPQKIVEHALNTAINTVEKAAETDVRRTAKRVEKATKKLQKVQKIAKAAKNAAKHASTMSSVIEKMENPEAQSHPSKKVKEKITEKIKEIIAPQKEISFYYDKRQLIVLTALYAMFAVFVYIVSDNLASVGLYNNWLLFGFLVATQILALLALASVVFVTTVPQRLALVNKDGIKIDHNQLLKWDDILLAEEKYTSYISRRPFMALHVMPEALPKYKLTFMQKLCRNNIFTPFSIPLYAMRPEDVAEIRAIIKKHASYKDNRN